MFFGYYFEYEKAVVIYDELTACILMAADYKPMTSFKMPKELGGDFFCLFRKTPELLSTIRLLNAGRLKVNAAYILQAHSELIDHLIQVEAAFENSALNDDVDEPAVPASLV